MAEEVGAGEYEGCGVFIGPGWVLDRVSGFPDC